MKLKWIYGFMLSSITSFVCLQATAAGSATSTPTIPTVQTTPQVPITQSGEAFMLENKNKPGVVTLPSGLQYKVIEAGSGKKPTKNDTVTVDYEGTLVNGKVFDSSYKRGQPVSFPVSGVIAGWQEALQLMNTGATWMLYIPSRLAYGPAGAGDLIGPNENLIFKVHLISIQ